MTAPSSFVHAVVFVALLAGVAGAGCSSTPRASGPNVVAVGKASGAAPGASAPPPCDPTRGTALDVERAEGTRIVEMCLTGASPETTAAIRKTSKLGPDKTLTADALRRDLESAYATGLLDQIEATARQSGTGSVLFLSLKERRRIAKVAFEGVVALKDDPKVAASFPKTGTPLNLAAVHVAKEKLREAYRQLGFDEAKVEHTVTPEGADAATLRIVVVEGTRAKVGKVTFDGARGGREVGLRKALELEDGAPLSDESLERGSLLLSAFYWDRGFMNARIASPKRTRAADGATAITFTIDEGPMFRVGKLRAKNVDAATEKEILAGMATKSGAVFSRSKLKADLEAIETRSRQKGKPVIAEPETQLDAKSATVDITLAVRETR